jgi:vancomycin resistance protein YoaR
VIDGGEIVDGMGGGVCQVASTLHAAALNAGLEVVDQRPHSRPSTYIALGLDATVVYPDIDLVIANPYDFPVTVRSLAADGEMYVELSGSGSAREVQLERRVLARYGTHEEVVTDPSLPSGTRVVERQQILGARVELVRHVHTEQGVVTERQIVRYPATPRLVRVGTG